jgi:recombination protein RecR
VLGGAICPLEGVGPENLNIIPLIRRVESNQISEIILATNQTPEGEATASYIASKLKHTQVKISCLARGIPVGSSIEAMDRVTVYKALSERRPY